MVAWRRPTTAGVALGLAGSMGLVTACLDAPTRTCEVDEECVLDDRQGTCQPDARCAYPSETCPSGSRYGPFADADADACTPDCTRRSLDLPCAEDPTCHEACERGDAVLIGTWVAPSADARPLDVAAGPDGGFAVTGAHGERPLVLVLDNEGNVSTDEVSADVTGPRAIGRAVASAPDGTYWLGAESLEDAQVPSRAMLLRFDVAGASLGGVGLGSLGIQQVLAVGVDDTGAATIAGRIDDRPWVERRSLDDAVIFSELWSDGFEPVDMAVGRGGRVAMIGTDDTGVSILRLLEVDGHLWGDVALGLGGGTTPVVVDLSGAGVVIGGERSGIPWVALADVRGTLRWDASLDAQSLVDVAVDERGWITMIGLAADEGVSAGYVRQLDAQGEVRWSRVLPVEEGAPVAVDLDSEQRPVVTGAPATGGTVWVRRFEP